MKQQIIQPKRRGKYTDSFNTEKRKIHLRNELSGNVNPNSLGMSPDFIHKFHRLERTQKSVPAWASGFEQDTQVFPMLRVTGLIPQFQNPKNFWKEGLQVFRSTRSSEFSRCWVMVSQGVMVQKNQVPRLQRTRYLRVSSS